MKMKYLMLLAAMATMVSCSKKAPVDHTHSTVTTKTIHNYSELVTFPKSDAYSFSSLIMNEYQYGDVVNINILVGEYDGNYGYATLPHQESNYKVTFEIWDDGIIFFNLEDENGLPAWQTTDVTLFFEVNLIKQ